MDNTQPRFSRKITSTGNSPCITIPKELMEFIDLNDTDEVEMIARTGTKGRYIAFWKKEKRMKV